MSLQDIKARADAATPGPWEWNPGTLTDDFMTYIGASVAAPGTVDYWGEGIDDYPLSQDVSDEDAAFIANARTDIPKLVAALEAVEQFASEMRDSQIAHDRAVGKVLRGMITAALA